MLSPLNTEESSTAEHGWFFLKPFPGSRVRNGRKVKTIRKPVFHGRRRSAEINQQLFRWFNLFCLCNVDQCNWCTSSWKGTGFWIELPCLVLQI